MTVVEYILVGLVVGGNGVFVWLLSAIVSCEKQRYVFPTARVVSYTPARRLQCARCGHTYARELGACLCTWIER